MLKEPQRTPTVKLKTRRDKDRDSFASSPALICHLSTFCIRSRSRSRSCCLILLEMETAMNTSTASPEKMQQYLDQTDLSDAEDAESINLTPFKIDWLNLDCVGCPQSLGLSALPGCRFQKTWRSLLFDLECIKGEGVEDLFSLCTKSEQQHYRVPKLFEKCADLGLVVHHYPIEDGNIPEMEVLMKLVEEIRLCLLGGRKPLVHCFGGYGRSCLVAACLMLVMDTNMDHQEASRKLKELKGDRAIQSIKQYNFLNEFENTLKKYREDHKELDSRSVSR